MTIEEICNKYNITNYTINSDNSIDVNGGVLLSNMELDKLPLKFNKVTGYFDCSWNKLTTLEGSPKETGSSFDCRRNKLVTLDGCPDEIGGDFYCSFNELTTLEGGPKSVRWDFDCRNNKLTDLKGSPRHIGGFLNCPDNKLISIEGCPDNIDGKFYCYSNPIGNLFNGVGIDFLKAFQTFKVLKGNNLNLKRFKYVMGLFDKKINLKFIKNNYNIV